MKNQSTTTHRTLLQRLLCVLMTAGMVLSCCIPAWGEEKDTEAPKTPEQLLLEQLPDAFDIPNSQSIISVENNELVIRDDGNLLEDTINIKLSAIKNSDNVECSNFIISRTDGKNDVKQNQIEAESDVTKTQDGRVYKAITKIPQKEFSFEIIFLFGGDDRVSVWFHYFPPETASAEAELTNDAAEAAAQEQQPEEAKATPENTPAATEAPVEGDSAVQSNKDNASIKSQAGTATPSPEETPNAGQETGTNVEQSPAPDASAQPQYYYAIKENPNYPSSNKDMFDLEGSKLTVKLDKNHPKLTVYYGEGEIPSSDAIVYNKGYKEYKEDILDNKLIIDFEELIIKQKREPGYYTVQTDLQNDGETLSPYITVWISDAPQPTLTPAPTATPEPTPEPTPTPKPEIGQIKLTVNGEKCKNKGSVTLEETVTDAVIRFDCDAPDEELTLTVMVDTESLAEIHHITLNDHKADLTAALQNELQAPFTDEQNYTLTITVDYKQDEAGEETAESSTKKSITVTLHTQPRLEIAIENPENKLLLPNTDAITVRVNRSSGKVELMDQDKESYGIGEISDEKAIIKPTAKKLKMLESGDKLDICYEGTPCGEQITFVKPEKPVLTENISVLYSLEGGAGADELLLTWQSTIPEQMHAMYRLDKKDGIAVENGSIKLTRDQVLNADSLTLYYEEIGTDDEEYVSMYPLDVTKGQITLDAVNTDTQTVTGTVVPGLPCTLLINGDVWETITPETAELSFHLPVSLHAGDMVTLTAADSFGYEKKAEQTVTSVDVEPVVVSKTDGNDRNADTLYLNDDPRTLTLEGTAHAGYELTLSVGSVNESVAVNSDGTWACALTLPDDLPENENSVLAIVYGGGKLGEGTEITLFKDTTVPDVCIEGELYEDTPSVAASSSDKEAVLTAVITDTDGNELPVDVKDGIIETNGMKPGTVLTLTATDKAGNSSVESKTVQPVLVIEILENGKYCVRGSDDGLITYFVCWQNVPEGREWQPETDANGEFSLNEATLKALGVPEGIAYTLKVKDAYGREFMQDGDTSDQVLDTQCALTCEQTEISTATKWLSGTTDPRATVKLVIDENEYTVIADENGVYALELSDVKLPIGGKTCLYALDEKYNRSENLLETTITLPQKLKPILIVVFCVAAACFVLSIVQFLKAKKEMKRFRFTGTGYHESTFHESSK